MTTHLQVRGLEKSFGATEVLRGVDLDVAEGSLAAVLGPSGCGKTTLLRVVAGFESPDAGSVAVGGRVVAGPGASVAPEKRRIGVVPQEGALFPHLSVAGNVAFGLARSARRRSRVEEMLALVGLEGFGDRMPAELSGGQQQRVAVARALAPEPALVLLDEPFSALDTGLRAALREDVRSALRATNATAVLVTHDQQEALSVADTVAVMRAGRVVQSGTPAEVYRHPADLQVATFVGEAVVLPAMIRDGLASTVLGPLVVRGSSAEGQRGHVAVRPEQLVLGRDGVGATVRQAAFFGHDALVTLDLERPGSTGGVVTARLHAVRVPPAGTTVRLSVTEAVSFFAAPTPTAAAASAG
ncbi:MAG TPA: ABC transporter ATP-binding protein [Actinomycetes bacterium]|nr:ABC transporter ATP-binding protein [Actinomycetes bacterium]